ncbi:MAG: hypothetical protein H6Q34_1047 [Deltaproteobacteria bacterium]|nr:hypothetical protein [Deltaproteobacteria bacterium]
MNSGPNHSPREGVADVRDRGRVVLNVDRHHVEADRVGVESRMARQEVLGDPHHLTLLRRRHRLERPALSGGSPGADLAEHQGVAVERHQIDLAGGGTHVTRDDGEATRREKYGGPLFTVATAALTIPGHLVEPSRRGAGAHGDE